MAAHGLSDDQLEEALKHLEEVLPETPAGVTRQVLAEGVDSLSKKQRYVFENQVLPSVVEKCATCPNQVPAGQEYCAVCEIEYG